MAHKSRGDAVYLLTFILPFLVTFSATIATETDIACLKSIKASLEDPFDHLSSWNFTNNTEGYLCSFTGVYCWHPYENKVLDLQLSHMGLKGQFPRVLLNCTSLTGLDLSYNELQGTIPSNISKISKFITYLDLSSNKFSGQIPHDIANLSYLNVLNLSNNHLTGQIPLEIGQLNRIKQFSVANNMLSGPVPQFWNATISADSYTNNSGLCGRPLDNCNTSKESFGKSFKRGFEVGYLVSAVSAIVVYASYCVPWLQTGKNYEMITVAAMVKSLMSRRKKNKHAEFDQFNSLSSLEFILENQVSTSENFVSRMSLKDLSNATKNFSQQNIIGMGQTGTMYKATLANGWSLAVKKFSNSQIAEQHFITELKTLGRLRHNNILPLIGFCKESKKLFLVYKYLSNGNLFDWLNNKKNVLDWPIRMKIAVGLARGLAWLHHCCYFRVAHLNISSKCILLDENFEPKLSNFRKATLINQNEINGPSGGFCLDIEFWEQCYMKEDVFSFGIVLLELITGKNATALTSSGSCCSGDDVDEVLTGQGHENEILELLRIGGNCVQPFPEQRPSMLDVYATISIISDKCESKDY